MTSEKQTSNAQLILSGTILLAVSVVAGLAMWRSSHLESRLAESFEVVRHELYDQDSAIFEVDPAGKVTRFNDEAAELLEVEPGKDFSEFFCDEFAEENGGTIIEATDSPHFRRRVIEFMRNNRKHRAQIWIGKNASIAFVSLSEENGESN